MALLESTGVQATTQLRHGDVVEAITEKEAGSELVVVGKRGEAAASPKVHLGSHLERVMRSVSKPLFVASQEFRPIERVLVAYDGSPSAMRAVDYLARSPIYAG